MIVTADAKLNLYLDITGRRSDGYHLLETVMQSVSLSDVLDINITEGEGITVSCDAPDIPSDESNIAYKAAQRYLDAAGVKARVDIRIQKRIPSGAGMGGGSSDAAAVLTAMNRYFNNALSVEKLYGIASGLGADVPFCLTGGTKKCRGIGDAISPAPQIKRCFFLVVMPDFTCVTKEAYAKFDVTPIPPRDAINEFASQLGGSFEGRMYNTFEVLYSDNRIKLLKAELMRRGARGALLTGSGAAVFGVFDSEETACEAAKHFPLNFTAVCTPTEESIHFA